VRPWSDGDGEEDLDATVAHASVGCQCLDCQGIVPATLQEESRAVWCLHRTQKGSSTFGVGIVNSDWYGALLLRKLSVASKRGMASMTDFSFLGSSMLETLPLASSCLATSRCGLPLV
jgi:hypothetical protein